MTEDSTKDDDKSKWGSHRKYIDLQYVISGEEKIGVTPVADVKVTEPYSAEKDIAHYSGPANYISRSQERSFSSFPKQPTAPVLQQVGIKRTIKL